MEYRRVMVLLIVMSVFITEGSSTSECGPGNQCKCSPLTDHKRYRMDCSGATASLRDICRTVGKDDKVVEIYIHSKKIKFIGNSDLVGCEQIERLDMEGCRIVNISDIAFKGMTKLVSLDLSGNTLTDLYTGQEPLFLQPLKGLRVFRLRILRELEENMTMSYPMIPDLQRLEVLHLDGLPDIDFPPRYNSLLNLTTLTLTGIPKLFCDLNVLTNKTFENLMTLENLDISQCKITNIEAGTFKVLPKLKRLDLSVNRQLGFEPLNNVSYGLQFTKIDFLNYSKNQNTFGLGHILTKQDVCYIRNTTLREVALDQLKLELFETNVAILMPDTLEILHVSDNQFTFGLYLLQMACVKNLTVIKADLQNLSHRPSNYVKESHKSESYCRKIPETSCPYLDETYLYETSKAIPNCAYFNETPKTLPPAPLPSNLKVISFSGSKLDYEIGNVPIYPFDNKIEYLDFSGNIAYSLEGPLGPAMSLKYLNMSRNYCFHIGPDFFRYMTNLEELNAQKNILGRFFENSSSAEVFKPLNKLKVVNFSHNQIKEISSNIFSHLPSLEALDLSYNSIDKWTPDTSHLRNLSHLNLGFNSMESLPDSIINQLTELYIQGRENFSIDLSNNPIRYVCRNKRFLTWMAEYKSSFIGFYHYTFLDENENLMTATEFEAAVQNIDKHCRSYTVLIVTTTVGITLFLSFIVSGMVYKNRWKLRYFLYKNRKQLSGYGSYDPLPEFEYDAFISYSNENSNFRDEIIQALEVGNDTDTKLRLCIHERDFKPGQPIPDNIIGAIQSSRKVIIALSKDYLDSKWCLYEFHMSRMESIYSRTGKSIVIVVMLEDVPINSKMPLELATWIRKDSYIEYTKDEHGQTVFWGRLREAIFQ